MIHVPSLIFSVGSVSERNVRISPVFLLVAFQLYFHVHKEVIGMKMLPSQGMNRLFSIAFPEASMTPIAPAIVFCILGVRLHWLKESMVADISANSPRVIDSSGLTLWRLLRVRIPA